MVLTKRPRPVVMWKPRSFVGLMSLYESNFLRLQRLLGGAMPGPGEALVSAAPGEPALQLLGLEQARYTRTLRLTYLFSDGSDPDLVMRVYTDANLVEAMHCVRPERHPLLAAFAPTRGDALQRRWARNLMLHKWLEHCHDRGHVFGPARMHLVEPAHAGLR